MPSPNCRLLVFATNNSDAAGFGISDSASYLIVHRLIGSKETHRKKIILKNQLSPIFTIGSMFLYAVDPNPPLKAY